MLKKLVVAAIAFVVLAAAAPSAHAQCHSGQRYYYLGNTRYECNNSGGDSFAELYYQTQDLVPGIWRMHDNVTDSRVSYEQGRQMNDYDRGRYNDSRYDRDYGRIPYPSTGSLGPPVWGRRYPYDSCRYSWNRRGRCRDYSEAQLAVILAQTGAQVWGAIETRKLRKEMERTNERQTYQGSPEERARPTREEASDEPEVRSEPKSKTLVNMTGCTGRVGGQPLAINGHISVPADMKRLFIEIDGPCDKYLEAISADVVVVKCR